MGIVGKTLLIFAALLLIGGGWLWWNRPRLVDMTAYVPADSIVYVEADSLTKIVHQVTATDAWRALAPPAGIETDFAKIDWLSYLVSLTGIGSSETVVLARAQIAVTVLGFEASEEDAAATLKIMPRAALVAETHTGESRTRAAMEKLVGDFARRVYGTPRVERKEVNGAAFITWHAPADSHRRLVATVSESVIIVGNDEGTVEACLAARRGDRPSLADNPELEQMRERVAARGALAFGFIPSDSAAKLLEIAALPFIGQFSANQRTQSVAASVLPQLANKIFGTAAWSTRIVNGRVEDRYFISLRNGLAARLREALLPAHDVETTASRLVPATAYQLTRYNYREPESAWRNFNAAISSQLDALSAPFVGIILDEALKPYGIEVPREFLRAAGPEIVTARLDDSGSSTVLIVAARDREALRAQVRKRLGSGLQTTRVGDAEMYYTTKPDRGAASFVDDFLIMGSAESVRRCLSAYRSGATLAGADDFRRAVTLIPAGLPHGVVTFSDDKAAAHAFVSYFARELGRERSSANRAGASEQAPRDQPFAVTMTNFAEDGVERTTHSAFGQFGVIVERFAPGGTSSGDR